MGLNPIGVTKCTQESLPAPFFWPPSATTHPLLRQTTENAALYIKPQQCFIRRTLFFIGLIRHFEWWYIAAWQAPTTDGWSTVRLLFVYCSSIVRLLFVYVPPIFTTCWTLKTGEGLPEKRWQGVGKTIALRCFAVQHFATIAGINRNTKNCGSGLICTVADKSHECPKTCPDLHANGRTWRHRRQQRMCSTHVGSGVTRPKRGEDACRMSAGGTGDSS